MKSRTYHAVLRWVLLCLLGLNCGATAQERAGEQPRQRGRQEGRGNGAGRRGNVDQGQGEIRMPTPAFRTDVPAHPVDLVLGRPTRTSITLSVLAYEDCEAWVAFGSAQGSPASETPRRMLSKGEPQEWLIDGLQPGTRYFYEFRSRRSVAEGFKGIGPFSFTTARAPGSGFTFTIQADPHLDFGTDPDVYRKSLANALAAGPDFHIDLGDTFMTDKYTDYRRAEPQYLAQRYYFGLLGHSVPVFLVLGNHDGEQAARGGRGADSMAVWSNAMRKKYFPNPIPDGFYGGNRIPDPDAGLLEDYYSWEWGDALFVVLDPFWYTPRQRGRGGDNWARTLGEEQYRWLAGTLGASRAAFKFVFLHHLVGGNSPEGRGGSEASRYFEWGGADLDGTNSFAVKRPGWAAPIHDLLVQQGVNAVFHGHDHFYACQERDGIVYQLVPQPGHSRFDNLRSAAEYGYREGELQGPSGILRVAIAPDAATVEYVRAYPDTAENAGRKTGAVTHRYRLAPRPKPSNRTVSP